MSCCSKCKQNFEDHVEWETCAFEDSGVFGGEGYPTVQIHPLVIPAGETRVVNTASPVMQTMYVTVIEGDLQCWFKERSGGLARPSGDQVHFEFTSDTKPAEIVLPPGAFSFSFGAGNSAACTASVVIMNREAYR